MMKIVSVSDIDQLVELWDKGLTYNEIAEEMGLTGKVVGSIVARLRESGYKLPLRRIRGVSVNRAIDEFLNRKKL